MFSSSEVIIADKDFSAGFVKNFVEKIYQEISNKQTLSTKLNFGAVSYRDNENMNIQANIEKLTNLAWKPKVSIKDGIKKILEEEK